MGIETIAAIGLGISAIGTAVGVYSGFQQAEAQKRAENLRERQMNLDAQRRKRETLREAIVARSQALATGTAQGAQSGSALAGGMAQITGRANLSNRDTRQNQQIGAGIFQANRDAASAQTLGYLGQGLTSFGGMMMNNAGTISRVGTYYTAPSYG